VAWPWLIAWLTAPKRVEAHRNQIFGCEGARESLHMLQVRNVLPESRNEPRKVTNHGP
jgi:hypothetical protein